MVIYKYFAQVYSKKQSEVGLCGICGGRATTGNLLAWSIYVAGVAIRVCQACYSGEWAKSDNDKA